MNGKVMIPLVAIPAGTLFAGIWLHTKALHDEAIPPTGP